MSDPSTMVPATDISQWGDCANVGTTSQYIQAFHVDLSKGHTLKNSLCSARVLLYANIIMLTCPILISSEYRLQFIASTVMFDGIIIHQALRRCPSSILEAKRDRDGCTKPLLVRLCTPHRRKKFRSSGHIVFLISHLPFSTFITPFIQEFDALH
ncbi:hypothetical protein F4776DRAFT_201316 [Hypoxylon sp. NC0597]|nr:hypothetical protein F4776DRAFT_201316 [Hypoxylon sp. NC0597]